MLEMVETLYDRGGIAPSYDSSFWNTVYNRGLGYNTEAYKRLLDELCGEAGVEVRFFAKVVEAEADAGRKEVHGLVVHQVLADGCRMKTRLLRIYDTTLRNLVMVECMP